MAIRVCRKPRPLTSVAGVAIFATALALTGCSEDPVAGPEASTLPPAATSSTPSVTGPVPTASGSTPTDAPTGPPVGPSPDDTLGPVAAPSEESTDARSVAPPAEVVTITSVSASVSGATEQLVIATTGGAPGVTVRYVDFVQIDDEPVEVDGDADLEVVLQAADPSGEQGMAPEVSTELYPEQPLLRHVRLARYLGDTLTFAVGLEREVPFTLTTTETAITITFYG